MPSLSKKHQALLALYEHCERRGDFVFHNDTVREICREVGFGNPFDATKIDDSAKLPQAFRQGEGVYIVHLGRGWHRFVRGVAAGYHRFEEIAGHERRVWTNRHSSLTGLDCSESNVSSVGFNCNAIQEFIGRRGDSFKIYRLGKPFSGTYSIAGQQIDVDTIQAKLDLVMESGGEVTLVAGKRGYPDDFAVNRLFIPYLCISDYDRRMSLALKIIQVCYLLLKDNVLRLYLYRFHGREQTSIELLSKAEYTLAPVQGECF